MSALSNYPMMDTLNSAMFRLSMEDLVDLERKRRCGMTRSEILNNIYCPAAGSAADTYKAPEARLVTANAVCIDGSRAALALSWSHHGSRNVDARRQEALRNVIEKKSASSLHGSRSDLPPILNCGNTAACERSEHKNFVVVSHGFPIDPDYAILSRPAHDHNFNPPMRNFGPSQISSNCTTPIFNGHHLSPRPRTGLASGRVSSMTINSEFSSSKNTIAAGIATPSRSRRTVTRRGQRKIKLFRKKTFLVNESSKSLEVNSASDAEMSEQENNNKADKLRIVQFSQETALSKSIRRKAKLEDLSQEEARPPSQGHLPLAVSPRFNWKDVETSYLGSSTIGEEQLTRQLIGLHRAVTHKDKSLLNQLVKAGTEMSLPLRGVTALSLSLYLKHTDMTSDLLAALRKTKQLARAINLPSVDNASRREPPIVTACRMGLLEAAALLVTHGADLETRDGQGRTALWHAVREEHDGVVEMLIHAGARVFYDNEDLACPTQLACKTALLKNRGRQMVKMLVRHGANLEYVDHALRNALYWSVYNCCGEIAVFLLDCGAVVKPWSWIADEALPTSFLEDPVIYHRVDQARHGPHSLSILARCRVRSLLSEAAGGCSIIPRIHALEASDETKAFLSLEAYPSTVSRNAPPPSVSVGIMAAFQAVSAAAFAVASANNLPSSSKKLKKLGNETKV